MATPLAELQPLIEALKSAPPQTFTDPVDQLRLQADLGVIGMAPFVRAVTLAEVSDHTIPVAGGEIPVRVYRPQAGSFPFGAHPPARRRVVDGKHRDRRRDVA